MFDDDFTDLEELDKTEETVSEGEIRELTAAPAQAKSVIEDEDYYIPTRIKGRATPGRKSQLTKSVMQKAIKYARLGNYDEVICDAIGVSRTTWYKWLRYGEETEYELEEIAENYDLDLGDREDRKRGVLEYLKKPDIYIRYYEFYRAIRRARGESEVIIASQVYKGSLDDPYLALQFLKSRWAQRYGTKKIELTGAEGGALQINSSHTVNHNTPQFANTDEEMLNLLQRAAARLPAPTDSPQKEATSDDPQTDSSTL